MNYIDTKVEEFEKIALNIVGEANNGREIAKLTILFEDTLTDLLTKAREAVPKANGTEAMHKCQCLNPIICNQWNACRNETLNNLNNL